MNIMTTGMHDRHFITLTITLCRYGCIGQATVFLYRQAIHVSSNQQSRPFAIVDHTNNTCATDPFGDFNTQLPKFTGEALCRLVFKKTQLRIPMEPDKQFFQMGCVVVLYGCT